MRTANVIFLILLAGLTSPTAMYGDNLLLRARLTASEEVPNPPITSTTGTARFQINDALTKIEFRLRVEGKVGFGVLGVAGAHIHCAPAGQNGPVVAFLAGAVLGGLDGDVEIEATLKNGNIINPVCGATIADLVQSMLAGQTYVNVHSAANPAGEVRGQIRRGGFGRP
jgi:hypothetical protein